LLRWEEYNIEDLVGVIPSLSAIPIHIRERLGWDGIELVGTH